MLPKLKKGDSIYFMGIAGTGMAAVAGLFKQAGYQVIGSDGAIYPPMSTMLAEQGIEVLTPYSEQNIKKNPAAIYVIANALSRSHVEIEQVLKHQLPYTSFPALLGEAVLAKKKTIVVCGTHGKTTTTALISHVLTELDQKPSFLIGGLPLNFSQSFHLDQGPFFVIEGDEYDTAFFDKESKFLHYRPSYIVANNIEYDHADIFPNYEALERMFAKFFALTPSKNIIANTSDVGLTNLLKTQGLFESTCQVQTNPLTSRPGTVQLLTSKASVNPPFMWESQFLTELWGKISFRFRLPGLYNAANAANALGCLSVLCRDELIPLPDKNKVIEAFESFRGVKRRFDLLFAKGNVHIYEDFAHHPTAVKNTIASVRSIHPKTRLIAAFEPRNASSRRNVFQNDYIEALKNADVALIGACPEDKRIPPEQRMNTSAIQEALGSQAVAFNDNLGLLSWLQTHMTENDTVLFMSSGDFSGIQHKLVTFLGGKIQLS